MSLLKVLDCSHWKGDIVNTNVDIDAVYTKATEGTYYIDDACDPIVQWAIKRGKKWGVYHFATNRITSPEAEADYFLTNCEGYIHRGMLILDYENYHWADGTFANNALDVAWAKRWLDHVYSRTNVKPLIYMSLSIVQGADWSSVINGGYGLICADYVDNNTPIPNFQMDANRDPNPHWDGTVNDVMWQFTSTGRIDGYNGNLDCNFFYGDGHTWDLYAGVEAPLPVPVPPVPTPPEPTPEPTPVPAPSPVPTPNEPQPTPQPSPAPSPAPQPHPLPKPAPKPGLLARIFAFILSLFIFKQKNKKV